MLSSFHHFTGFNLTAFLYPVFTLHNRAKTAMYSFFQYTPVVNYGSEVNDASFIHPTSVFTMACGSITVPGAIDAVGLA